MVRRTRRRIAPGALDLFGRYAERVATSLGDLVPYMGTVNEPQVVALMGYLAGGFPPGLQDLETARLANRTFAAAHRTARRGRAQRQPL